MRCARPLLITFVVLAMLLMPRQLLRTPQLVQTSACAEPWQRRVAVIGAGGFIGSRLYDHLRASGVAVEGFDREPGLFERYPDRDLVRMSSRDVPPERLQCFSAVVYLGGLTGRVACDGATADQVREENVEDVARLASRMSHPQLLIFASTSAIAEGSGGTPFAEDDEPRADLHDRYTHSLYARELALEALGAPPQVVGLRFGTVVGISPSQRTDMVFMALVRSVFLQGRMRVNHPQMHRAFLWTDHLVRAVEAVIRAPPPRRQRFGVYHLSSFNCNLAKLANHIAWRTGARAHFRSEGGGGVGFSLNTTKFERAWPHVEGNVSIGDVLDQMIEHAPRLMVGRDHHAHPSAACVVCGATKMIPVLDLRHQPLANDFRPTAHEAHNCTRHPLELVRCPVCQHAQLSHFVPRAELFTHYLYQSGTSAELRRHFAWLADKVVEEAGVSKGAVLELACNDGSQLDQFKRRGWRTYGVDPAANIAVMATAKGHDVRVGFWPFDTVFPPLDAIVAQNVVAHTDRPVEFMIGAAKHMGPHTRLYVQTSQCRIFDTGQFDTIYHEHISFFTPRSFERLGARAGLRIVALEHVPIHGESCLVTYQLGEGGSVVGSAPRPDWFFIKYRERALDATAWVSRQLAGMHAAGMTIVGYGAAAKGVVLLHALLGLRGDFAVRMVIDDAPLKQGMFCPGTAIPVRNSTALQGLAPPFVVVVFAWNFLEEIAAKVSGLLGPGYGAHQYVVLVVPFPEQRAVRLFPSTGRREAVLENRFRPIAWPLAAAARPPVVLFSHFHNEAFLMAQFIRNHASMFDAAVLVDCHSTDATRAIIAAEAPPTWRVVTSRHELFLADEADKEVSTYEAEYPGAWRLALTTSEFVLHPGLRAALAESNGTVLRFHGLNMVGSEDRPYDPHLSLAAQRTVYACAGECEERFSNRRCERTSHDHLLPAASMPDGVLLKYIYTPWPEIGARIPRHVLDAARDAALREGRLYDLRAVGLGADARFGAVWSDVIGETVDWSGT